MKKLFTGVVAALAATAMFAATATAAAHFVRADASLIDGGKLEVSFKIAGLGDTVTTTVTASAAQPAGSPATTEPIPVTPETLAGIWRVEDPPTPGILNQIGADGSFVFDMEGVLDTDPFGTGTYELNGTELIISVTNGACSDWAFRVDDIPEDGRVLATYSRSGCHVNAGEPWNLTRLSPMSPSASAIVEPITVSDAPVELSPTIVEGIWLREGTGQLASFTSDGRYSVDDGGLLGVDPDDTGHYEIDGDTFVLSTDGTGSCAAATTATWTAAILDAVKFTEDDALNTRRLRLTAPDNECVGWTSGEQTWLRVSP
jgi:hypothetical protein